MNDAIRKQVRPGWQPVNRTFATVAAGDPNVHVLDIAVSGDPPDNEPNFDAWSCTFRNIHLGRKAFHELTRLIFDGCIPGALGLVTHDLPPTAPDRNLPLPPQAPSGPAVSRRHLERARANINRWVADQTRERIKDLPPAGSPNDTTRLVLVNALYFKAAWVHQFRESATSHAPLHLPPLPPRGRRQTSGINGARHGRPSACRRSHSDIPCTTRGHGTKRSMPFFSFVTLTVISKPGPRSRWTSIAPPIARFDRPPNPILRVPSCSSW